MIGIAAAPVVLGAASAGLALSRDRDEARMALSFHTDSTLVRVRANELVRRADSLNTQAGAIAAEADRTLLPVDTSSSLGQAVMLERRARDAATLARAASFDALESAADLAQRAERELADARVGRDSLVDAMRARGDSLTARVDSLSASTRAAVLRGDSLQAQLARTRQGMRDSIRISATLTAAAMADSLLKLVRDAQAGEIAASRRASTLQAERDSLAYALLRIRDVTQKQKAPP